MELIDRFQPICCGKTSRIYVYCIMNFSFEHSLTPHCYNNRSCNKQYKPQPAWEQIAELNPQAWLWMGDAVYVASPYTVEQQLKGLQHQMRVPEYIEFLKRVPIVEGVWDDHDIGPNVSQGSQSNNPQHCCLV